MCCAVALGAASVRSASAGFPGAAAGQGCQATFVVSGWPGQLPLDFLLFYLLPREARGRAGRMKNERDELEYPVIKVSIN